MVELALHLSNPEHLRTQSALLASCRLTDWRFGPRAVPLETKAFAASVSALSASTGKVNRLYLGNEFCPYLTWSREEVLEGVDVAMRQGYAITLVFGPQGERLVDDTLSLVNEVAGKADVEVVTNDIGLLTALVSTPATVVLGRMLFKAKRNPRISPETTPQSAEPGKAASKETLARQLAQWALLPQDSPWQREWLDSLKVTRADIEMVPQGLRTDPDNPLPLSLHLPWTYITGGGHCPVARLTQRDEKTVCARRCRQSWIESTYPTRTWPMPQVGQTVFSPMVSLFGGYGNQPRIDRYIVEPALPM